MYHVVCVESVIYTVINILWVFILVCPFLKHVFNAGAIQLKAQCNQMHCVALGAPDANPNVDASSIFKFIHLKLFLHATLQHPFDRHLKKLYV